MRDLGIADRLRAAGLAVVEVNGWQTRGDANFEPHIALMHHTAGSGRGACPSLGVNINGRSGIPGPLVQVLQSREPFYHDQFYVIASGRANHAGVGSWMGWSGNKYAFGIEVEHDGVSPLPIERQQLTARALGALLQQRDTRFYCQHREYAKPAGRKIDAATNVDPDNVRRMVGESFGAPSAPPSQEVEMWVIAAQVPAGSQVAPGECQIGLPLKRQSCVVDLFLGAPHDQGCSLWAAQVYEGGAEAIGLWDNGNKWEMWVPGHQSSFLSATVGPKTSSLQFLNKGPRGPVLVTVSGT